MIETVPEAIAWLADVELVNVANVPRPAMLAAAPITANEPTIFTSVRFMFLRSLVDECCMATRSSARSGNRFAARYESGRVFPRLPVLPRCGVSTLYLGVGLVAIGAYYAFKPDTVAQTVAYCTIGLYGTAAVVAGARRNLVRERRAPWYLFGLGLLAFVVGDSIFDTYTLGGHALPFPSAADAVYLTAYPILFAGMAVLLRRIGRRESRFAFLDASIATCGFLLGPC